jgi:hypothetical protein
MFVYTVWCKVDNNIDGIFLVIERNLKVLLLLNVIFVNIYVIIIYLK